MDDFSEAIIETVIPQCRPSARSYQRGWVDTSNLVSNWEYQQKTGYTHLFILKPPLTEKDELKFLRSSLTSSTKFTLIYEGDAGMVFQVNGS